MSLSCHPGSIDPTKVSPPPFWIQKRPSDLHKSSRLKDETEYRSYLAFSSMLSSNARARMENLTGVSTQHVLHVQRAKEGYESSESSTTRVNATGYTRSLHSNDSRLEAGLYNDTPAPSLPGQALTTDDSSLDGHSRDRYGMAINQDIALANLDPRTRNSKPGPRLGVSTPAIADEFPNTVPNNAIGVNRDWRLDRE